MIAANIPENTFLIMILRLSLIAVSGFTSNTIDKNKSIQNFSCLFVYKYNIPEKIRNYKGTVLFWRGSNEQYPRKSAALLKKYLPDLIDVEIEHMGHGQYLHERSDEYASKLIEYLQV